MSHFLVNSNQNIQDHLRMIQKIAWNLSEHSNHEYEDLFSEGCLQYLLVSQGYDPRKGVKFETFVWTAVRNRLIDYLRKSSHFVSQVNGPEIIPIQNKQTLHEVFTLNSF